MFTSDKIFNPSLHCQVIFLTVSRTFPVLEMKQEMKVNLFNVNVIPNFKNFRRNAYKRVKLPLLILEQKAASFNWYTPNPKAKAYIYCYNLGLYIYFFLFIRRGSDEEPSGESDGVKNWIFTIQEPDLKKMKDEAMRLENAEKSEVS